MYFVRCIRGYIKYVNKEGAGNIEMPMYRGYHTRARPIDNLLQTNPNMLHLLHLNRVPSYENIYATRHSLQ